MPRYEWTRSEPFRDFANDRVVAEGEVVEIAEEVAAPAYGFVEADETDANPGEDSEDEGSTASAESDGTDYAEMDYAELRQLAVDADTDEINGRSSKDEIVAYLTDE